MPKENYLLPPPLEVPFKTWFTRRDATIIKLLSKTSNFSPEQIIRFAVRKYLTEKLNEETPQIGG